MGKQKPPIYINRKKEIKERGLPLLFGLANEVKCAQSPVTYL